MKLSPEDRSFLLKLLVGLPLAAMVGTTMWWLTNSDPTIEVITDNTPKFAQFTTDYSLPDLTAPITGAVNQAAVPAPLEDMEVPTEVITVVQTFSDPELGIEWDGKKIEHGDEEDAINWSKEYLEKIPEDSNQMMSPTYTPFNLTVNDLVNSNDPGCPDEH